MARLGESAREHEDVTHRIEDSCMGRVVLNTASGEVTGVLTGTCQGLRNEAARLEKEIRSGIVHAKEDARRAGVYPGKVREWRYEEGQVVLGRGEEMGRFLLGSTVVMLFPQRLSFNPAWVPGGAIRMGEAMAG